MTEFQERIVRDEFATQIATILRKILNECPMSGEFVNASEENEFFEDSCNFSNLRYEISELVSVLRNLVRYSKMLMEENS